MAHQPKYPKPKILLLDLESEVESILKDAGYNVTSGSFGVPYKVPRYDSRSPVIPNGSLPNFTEQEVVVMNLMSGNEMEEPSGEKLTSFGEPDWWASNSRG